MSVEIKWNGDNFEDALNKAAFEQASKEVAKRLRAVRCPVHHLAPTSVTITGHDLSTLGWKLTGCCDSLFDTASAALK